MGPGVVFSIAALIYIRTIKKINIFQTPLSPLWILMCSFAYFSAVWIVLSFTTGGESSWTAPVQDYNENAEKFNNFMAYGLGGLIGSFLMLLGFKYFLLSISLRNILFLTILGGMLSLSMPLTSQFLVLFVFWQTGMATALGFILDKNDRPLISSDRILE